MRKTFIALALAGTTTLGVGGVVAAQSQSPQPHGERGMMSGMMDGMMGNMREMMGRMMRDCPMMGAMGSGPSAALEQRETLGLTHAQAEQMESLRSRASAAQSEMMPRMHAIHAELAQLTGRDQFDKTAVRRTFARMGELHTDMGVAMLRAQHDVQQVLTPEQRAILAKSQGERGQMMGGDHMRGMMGSIGNMDQMGDASGMGMMQHCPMMQRMMQGMMQSDTGASQRLSRPDSTSGSRQ